MTFKNWLFFFCLLFVYKANSQNAFIGLKLSTAVGSHRMLFGIGAHASVAFSNCLLSAGSDFTFGVRDFGNRKQKLELRSYLGAGWLENKQSGYGSFELGTLMNNFNSASTLGYAYILYLDNKGTSQCSGAMKGEFSGHSLYFENDFLAGQGRDRFRTAQLVYAYRKQIWLAKVGLILWTGEASGLQVKETRVNNMLVRYKDLSINPYGRTSHGILYGGLRYNLLSQSLGIDVGIDAEQIRNVFQNLLVHHPRWHKRQPEKAVYYPMLDAYGKPTFVRENVRPAQTYFQVGCSLD